MTARYDAKQTANRPVIVWFRDDLRCSDHPALHHAASLGQPVIAVYVHDEVTTGIRPLGAAQKWFLHQSLEALGQMLSKAGCRLHILVGPSEAILRSLVSETSATGVYWLRRTGKAGVETDERLEAYLSDKGVETRSFNGNLLHEPSRLRTMSDGPFRVYTPFFKALLRQGEPRQPVPAPDRMRGFDGEISGALGLAALQLRPANPNWAAGWERIWPAGEAGAWKFLDRFVKNALQDYARGRDFPAAGKVSRLSPYLRFGVISPYQFRHLVQKQQTLGKITEQNATKFLSELAWREFCQHLAFHFPDLHLHNYQAKFDHFPWQGESQDAFACWKKGLTGYPIVDAGMRELWQTGYMHNRVRMVVASFLTKHLLIDWRAGERWFWETLVDGDAASNPANWQWVAGCGADAAPYFRIFNPVLQGRKFDPEGNYVRRYVPEIAGLPDKYLHAPWEAPGPVAEQNGIVPGKTYPLPIVDHATARMQALAALKEMADESPK